MTAPVWNTPAGSIGTYPSSIALSYQLSASPIAPATSITYTLLSGALPTGLSITSGGLISGTPNAVSEDTIFTFAIRATDNLDKLTDRTFSFTINGVSPAYFTTPEGNLFSTLDSLWIESKVEYVNPNPELVARVRLVQGNLPPGLEINEVGLIRGYPQQPKANVAFTAVAVAVTASSNTDNSFTCFSITGFAVNRPIVFTGTVFGGVVSGRTYYIRSLIFPNKFTISDSEDGPEFVLATSTGLMNAQLPAVSIGQPTIRTYNFILDLSNEVGSQQNNYSITVVNQNTPVAQGGPGLPANTRVPTLYNTRPPSYDLSTNPAVFDYYVLPSPTEYGIGATYPTTELADIGEYASDNFFSFRMLGHDFDNDQIQYSFSSLPAGLIGNPQTGWITGLPSVIANSVSQFSFSVAVQKVANPAIISPFFNFEVVVGNGITKQVNWLTDFDLGTIDNGTVSTKFVFAEADVQLLYRTTDELPPNLVLLPNGEIAGTVALQPEPTLVGVNTQSTFAFTIEAYSPVNSLISSSRTFILTVLQEFDQPTDTLYIKAAPPIEDRVLLETLLQDEAIIPTSVLYRPDDSNFGKATNITYVHAYGIFASNLDEYVDSVTRNHYWRDITLGQIETAQARDELGTVIYEVVYSRVIDNLINPQGISINQEIFWPRPIDLSLGPWYTSVTNTLTSFVQINQTQYYTSLTPGYAQTLYPNSLPNMRNRVGQVLGQDYNYKLLPAWMTSQQQNGSTLGFTPAWVICYTQPGFAETVKNNIETKWTNEFGRLNTLNQIDFQIDRFTVNKSLSYDYTKNIPVVTSLVTNINSLSTSITVVATETFPTTGRIKIGSEIIAYGSINRATNTIADLTRGVDGTAIAPHFTGDAVRVDLSYWADLPSATPPPNPIDSRDFFVLFPRKTILPTQSQY